MTKIVYIFVLIAFYMIDMLFIATKIENSIVFFSLLLTDILHGRQLTLTN